MKSEAEKDRIKTFEDAVSQMTLEVDQQDVGPGQLATFCGIALAVCDLLFAIRDGEDWRDISDPSEMTRTILKELGLGD